MVARCTAASVVLAVAIGVVAAAPSAGAAEPAPAGRAGVAPAERVLIVSLPTLRWRDVLDLEPPNLLGFLEGGAVASMSLRTIGSVPDIGRSYATIGAGNRATARVWNDGQIYPPGATYEGGEAGPVFERRCGCEVADAAAVHLGIAQIQVANDNLLYGAVPGSLGQALRDAGRTAAAIGNADEALAATSDVARREVGLAVMDHDGRVQRGAVGAQLLVDDPTAPFGVRMDLDATRQAFESVWADTDLVLLEMSDLIRADRYASVSTPAARRAAREAAMAAADDLLGDVLAAVDPERDLVIVLSPTDPSGGEVELGIAAIAGPGFEPGLARSGTTRRDGYVTLPDVAPTVLAALDVAAPSSMTGSTMAAAGGDAPDADTYAGLARDNDIDVFRGTVIGSITIAYIVIQVATYALALAALSTRRRGLRRAGGFLALMTMSMPSVAFLSGLFPYDRLGTAGYFFGFLAAAAALGSGAWLVARAAGRRVAGGASDVPPVAAPVLLAALLLVVLLVDIATGGSLQINTVWGYVATVAGRFAGYGNLAFGLVAISAIVVGTGVWGLVRRWGGPATGRRHRRRDLAALVGVSVLFVVTVIAIGLPQLGSDVGGVLASVPAFVLTVLLLAGVVLTWKRVALVGASSVLVLGLFGLIDLARPEGSRSHLGRTFGIVLDGDLEQMTTILQRKLAANLNILMSSAMAYVIPAALAFLCFLAWRRPGFLRQLEARVAGARTCIIGGLVVGVLAALVNDSGVAIPAMMFGVLLPYLTVLLLRTAEPAA